MSFSLEIQEAYTSSALVSCFSGKTGLRATTEWAPGEQAARHVDVCTALTSRTKLSRLLSSCLSSLALLFLSCSIQILSLDTMAKKEVPGTSNILRSTLIKPVQPPVLNTHDGGRRAADEGQGRAAVSTLSAAHRLWGKVGIFSSNCSMCQER